MVGDFGLWEGEREGRCASVLIGEPDEVFIEAPDGVWEGVEVCTLKAGRETWVDDPWSSLKFILEAICLWIDSKLSTPV